MSSKEGFSSRQRDPKKALKKVAKTLEFPVIENPQSSSFDGCVKKQTAQIIALSINYICAISAIDERSESTVEIAQSQDYQILVKSARRFLKMCKVEIRVVA
jgi:hypothetical protein